MRKMWNVMGKMTVCTLAAAVMVMMGTELGITARAEMIIDSEAEILEVQEMVPVSDDMGVLQADAPAAEELQEAGDMEAASGEIAVGDIVVIEDDLVPGAALPDFNVSAPEGEAEAPEEAAVDMADGEEETIGAEGSETGISGMLTYEDEEVAVTVMVSGSVQLPADTEVKVTKLAEGSEQYEAAKEAACAGLEPGEEVSCAFYDVTLESEGQALDVEEGTVSVQMEFKTSGTGNSDVVQIEETESGTVARNVTADKGNGSVAINY